MPSIKSNKLFNKKNYISLYIVISIIFIIITIYNDAKVMIYDAGVQNGQIQTINNIISKGLDVSCEPLTIFSEEKSVDLINVKCLSKTQNIQ